MKPILPRARNDINLRYYTTGECNNSTSPARFTHHSAEPGAAASILQRNPHFSESIDIKPSTIRTSGLIDQYNPSINTLSSVKQVQSREFA